MILQPGCLGERLARRRARPPRAKGDAVAGQSKQVPRAGVPPLSGFFEGLWGVLIARTLRD